MKITTVIDNRMHNSGPTRSPMIIYLHTKRGKNSTHLHSGLRAGSQWRLTVNSRSTPQLPMSPANGRHPPTTPPQRSCHQVEACCWARIPQATWHMEGTSTLIGANHSVLAVTASMRDRRSPRPVAGARPGSLVQGDSYCGVRSETIPQRSARFG